VPASDLRAMAAGPAIDDYLPLHLYDWWWWLALPLFAALLVAWILVSRRLARVPDAPAVDVPAAPAPFRPRPDAGALALARIDEVERRVAEGELEPRSAHVELSAIVREFARDRTGVDASAMTLSELRARHLDRVADVVAGFYPIAFAPRAPADVDVAVARARGLVADPSAPVAPQPGAVR
jgi:hypothetical protein